MRKTAALLAATALVAATTACSGGAEEDGTVRTLRIGTTTFLGGSDSYYRQQFAELYEFAHPNVRIEFVSSAERSDIVLGDKAPADPVAAMKEMMAGPNPPDLVMVDFDQLPDLIDDHLLVSLDAKIKQDKFDLEGIVPTVKDGIRELGDGSLYALAPYFDAPALFYNKRIFQKAGVEAPTDGMTWDRVVELARKVSSGDGKERIYGLGLSPYAETDDFYNLMSVYGAPLKLRAWNESEDKMNVATPEWEQAWTWLADLKKEKIVPPESANEDWFEAEVAASPATPNAFFSGRLAMTVGDSYMLDELAGLGRGGDGNAAPIEWDVVSMPSHPKYPGVAGMVRTEGLMGINVHAGNPDDAWEFLKFVNSDEWAKTKSRGGGMLVARGAYNKGRGGLDYRAEAFADVRPAPADPNRAGGKSYLNEVLEAGRTELQPALRGDKTIKEALEEWGKQGQAILDLNKAKQQDGNS